MQLDSYFTQGVSHKVCEDYTMHGMIGNIPYIIVCDGCSGSKETDFGSRLVARSARESLRSMLNKNMFDNIIKPNMIMKAFEQNTVSELGSMLKSTRSDVSVADATLLMSFKYKEKIYVFMRGDGVYTYQDTNGILNMTEIEFYSGAPYYLSYDLDILNDQLYEEQFNQQKNIIHRQINNNIIDEQSEVVSYDHMIFDVLDASKVNFISLMSDGVSAFQFRQNYMNEHNEIHTKSHFITTTMNSYKNHNGEFVQRRMKRAMRDFHNKGLENFDDVSIATMWLKED